MLYLRIDDLRLMLLAPSDHQPTIIERNILPGRFPEVLHDLSSATTASHIDVLVNGPVTIVPTEELREMNAATQRSATNRTTVAETLYQSCFAFNEEAPRHVLENPLPSLRHTVLFSLHEEMYDAIQEQYADSEIRYISALTPLLRYFATQRDPVHRQRVYVYCRQRFIDVFAFEDRHLMLLNSFPVGSIEDAIYFVLTLSQSLGFDVKTIPFTLIGDRGMTSDLTQGLSRFVQRVDTATLSGHFVQSPYLDNPAVPYDLALHIVNK